MLGYLPFFLCFDILPAYLLVGIEEISFHSVQSFEIHRTRTGYWKPTRICTDETPQQLSKFEFIWDKMYQNQLLNGFYFYTFLNPYSIEEVKPYVRSDVDRAWESAVSGPWVKYFSGAPNWSRKKNFNWKILQQEMKIAGTLMIGLLSKHCSISS